MIPVIFTRPPVRVKEPKVGVDTLPPRFSVPLDTFSVPVFTPVVPPKVKMPPEAIMAPPLFQLVAAKLTVPADALNVEPDTLLNVVGLMVKVCPVVFELMTPALITVATELSAIWPKP